MKNLTTLLALIICSPLIAVIAVLIGVLVAVGFFIGAFIVPFTGLPKSPRRKAEEPSTTTHSNAVAGQFDVSVLDGNSLGRN